MGGCVCHAQSDVLKSSPSQSASSFQLCFSVRSLMVEIIPDPLFRGGALMLFDNFFCPPHKTSLPTTGILNATFYPQVSLWIITAASTFALPVHSDGHHSCLLRSFSKHTGWYFEVQYLSIFSIMDELSTNHLILRFMGLFKIWIWAMHQPTSYLPKKSNIL